MIYTTISKCGLCGSENLDKYLDFGLSPLANSLKTTSDETENIAPLRVAKCEGCDCFQLLDIVKPEIMFSNYLYKSPDGLKTHFENYVSHTFSLLNLKKDDLMLGIGGNVGLLETEYQKLGLSVANIEPAQNIAFESRKNGVFTINDFFDKNIGKHFKTRAKLIAANNVLAHSDLTPIIDGVKELLDKSGYLVMENSYWLDVVKQSDAFQVYSEHYKYLSIKPLQKFFDSHGFDLFRVEYNKIQCGSFRAYIKWKENDKFCIDSSVAEAIKNEELFNLYDKQTYIKFTNALNERKIELNEVLNRIICNGQTVGLFSVAAKTVLMLKYFDISHFISLATDDSDLKWNRFIPGTSIKIIDKKSFFEHNFDYLIIGAFNFKNLIIEKNNQYKGKWINIMPKLEII